MGKKYQLENDHIFPFSRLKAAGYGKDNRVKYSLAQELTNRAILTQVANRTKSAKEAADYLAEVRTRAPNALRLQSIPNDESLWQLENFEQFLIARRTVLAGQLNDFLDGIAVTEANTAAVSIEDLIAEGESDELEFKSSLRWDYQNAVVNKVLEGVIVKAVGAFANSQGGTLLIGVDDSGVALGLEQDYGALGGADADKYERHLRTLLINAYGEAFVASKLKVSFPVVGDVEICQLVISPSTKLLVTKGADKNGRPSEKFYVRNGNASRELPVSEVQSYMAERFS